MSDPTPDGDGSHKPLYRIMSGVHRCVAAREAGLSGIFAEIVDDDGRGVGRDLVPLAVIYSPKREIDRWDRGRDFAHLIELMGSVAGRAAIEPVTLSPVLPTVAGYLTPLLSVRVTDSEEGET